MRVVTGSIFYELTVDSISIAGEEELQVVEKVGRILAETMEALESATEPGATEEENDAGLWD